MHSHSAPLPSPSRPILKWAGGKFRLLSQLLPLLPAGSRLIEPFVGAGSVFLAVEFDSYVINDANPDLVALWTALQCRPREYIDRAQELFVQENLSQNAYLRIRAEFNASTDRFERAVRLAYLNRFGFNGLFRVNSKGAFNTPYGKPTKVPNLPVDEMAAAALKLERCTILNGGYAAALEMARVGDVIYCDPPYLDSEGGKSFTGYTSTGFNRAEHEQLLESCVQAVSRGAHVLISNHDTEEVRALYRGWDLAELSVRRSVGAGKSSRRVAKEVVAILPATRSARQSR